MRGLSLANGSIVVDKTDEHVLCVLPHNTITPYATWIFNSTTLDTSHGNYFRTLGEAVEDLAKRS